MYEAEGVNYKYCPLCGTELKEVDNGEKKVKRCPRCGWTFYDNAILTVSAIIIRGGKVLLVRRAREPYVGTWMFPAGFVGRGESPCDALVREVEEETGYKVVSARPIDAETVPDDPRNPGHAVMFWKVEVEDKPGKVLDSEENQAVEWHDLSEPGPNLGWVVHQKVWKNLLEDKY